MRKIAVLTGKRGGFGAMMGLMQMIRQDPETELQLIVTDMHLSSFFGYTATEVQKFFPISYKLELNQKDDTAFERAQALSRCLSGMVNILQEAKPDILVTLGDRGEVLSACIAAFELNIPVAHILGGDVAGNRDGSRIHAITKLAHIHFPSSLDSADRILKLGEEPWRVKNVGASYVDFIVQKSYTPNDEVRKKYNIADDEPYILCIQHPMTLQEERSYAEAKAVYTALAQTGLRTLIMYPCSDQGYMGVVKALQEFENTPGFSIHKNIEALDFWGLMSGAEVFVGNSSSGLMETPYFDLPAVNIGKRQEGRIRDTNVIDSEPSLEAIQVAIEKARSQEFRARLQNHFIFGNGTAGEQMYEVLKNVELGEALLMKKMTY